MFAGWITSYVLLALFLAPSLLPGAGPLGTAQGARLEDRAILGTATVQGLEVNLTGSETFHNTTVFVPLNASAHIISGQVNLTGKMELKYVNLTGRGGAGNAGEEFGHGTDTGGDFNKDGYGDLAVGTFAENSASRANRVEVFWGSPQGLRGRAANWTYAGPANSGFGFSVAHGDYNGDNIDDLVVGESAFFSAITERVSVFYGSSGGLASSPDLLLTFNASTSYSWGYALVGGLNLDNDAYQDLVVGEAFNTSTGTYKGTVTVLWGSPNGLNVTNSTLITGFDTNYGGSTTSPALILEGLGDTDADGYGEFAAGTAFTAGQFGAIQVFEGSAGRAVNRTWNFTNNVSSFFGWAVAGGRDITGDGVADLAVGAPTDTATSGAVYVFAGAGNATYAGPVTVLRPADTSVVAQFGAGVEMLADFDGDGKSELVVGANAADAFDGYAYLFWAYNLTLDSAVVFRAGTPGLAESFGWYFGSSGDVNGDGLTELPIHLASGINGTVKPGALRLYYGNAHPLPEDVRVFVNRTQAWTQGGSLGGNVTANGLGPLIQAYLNTHQADVNATGFILVPLSFNFSLGGRLNVSQIAIAYSVVLPPRGLTITAPPNGGALVLSWQLQATDGAVNSIWSNKTGSWGIIGNVSFPRFSFNDTNVTDGRDYWYYITETDPTVPITSAPSPIVTGRPVDITPPRAPVNFTASVDGPGHSITLAWSPNLNDTARYEVWRRDGDIGSLVQHAIVNAPAATSVDSGLLEEVNYTYQVRAIDAGGLASPFTAPLTQRIPDLTAPPTPVNFQATTHPSGTAAVLSWNLNGGDTVTYVLLRSSSGLAGSFVEVDRSPTSPFTSAGLTRNSTYHFALMAVDKVGLESPPTAAVSVLTVDTLAPDAPVLASVTVLGVGNSVVLNWTAAGDDLAGFRLYTDLTGGWIAALQVGGSVRTAIIGNLTDGQLTHFRVAAFDLGARQGADSNALAATPGDTVRPAAPTTLLLVAPPTGAVLILSWTAPADSDVVLYKVWYIDPTVSANWVLAGTSTAATFTHAPVKNGATYRYQVSALDEVPNESPPSESVSGTARDTVAPSAPIILTGRAVTNDVTFAVTGTAEPNLTVQLWVRGVLQATVDVDATGAWSATARLITGDNAVTAKAVDPSPIVDAGARVSIDSQTLHLTLDTARPTVVASTPATGATGVDPTSPLAVTFSEDVEAVVVTVKDADGNTVAGTLTLDGANHSARFTPASPLKAGATYQAEVTSNDLAGNAMAPTTVTFTTASGSSSGGTGGGFLPGLGAPLAAFALAGVALSLAVRGGRKRA